jgi:hypothetical protein
MAGELPSRRRLVVLAVAVEGGLGLLALGLGAWLGVPPLASLHWTATGVGWGLAGSLPMLVLIAATPRLRLWPFPEIHRVIDELLVPLFRDCGLIDLAVIAGLAGLGEEMLFRGVAQPAVAQWVGGPWAPWIGLAAAALLFGLAHPITFGYVVLAAAMGLYLGWLLIATDNLLVPVLAHGLYDFIALVWLVKARPSPVGWIDKANGDGPREPVDPADSP